MSDIGVTVSIGTFTFTVVGFIVAIGKILGRLESEGKRNSEKFQELNQKIIEGDIGHEKNDNEHFVKLEKYASEFYERITKLEVWQGGQNQINQNVSNNLENIRAEQQRTNTKLDIIEGLLRSRRFEDK